MHTHTSSYPMAGLPDPELDAEFYDGVLSKRLVAWFIDALAIFMLSIPAVILFGIFTLGFGFFAAPGVIAVIAFLYRALTISNRSATWGMRAMGIEFRTGAGARLDFTIAALHTLIYFFLMASMIGWVISIICMLSTRYGQGLGDLLLGTTAINRPAE